MPNEGAQSANTTDASKPVAVAPAEVKPENPQTGPKNVAWDIMFNDFCTPRGNGTYPSLRELAEKYKVADGNVFKKSTEDNWVERRSVKMAEREQKVQEASIKDTVEANQRHLRRWRWVQNITMQMIKDFESAIQIYKTGDVTKMKGVKEPSIHSFEKIVSTLKTSIEGERVVLGLPTSVSKVETDAPELTLPRELIKEIDNLFEKNEKATNENPTTN